MDKVNTNNLKTSDDGIALIREFEGCKLTAYQDSVEVWTIGVGHTGPDVFRGRTITEKEADELLRKDLAAAERCVNMSVFVPLTQGEFDSLVSFVFNLGCGNLRGSTLLRKLNDGDYDGAEAEFPKWDKAGGRVLAGLTRRRKAEQDLFERSVA